MDNSAQNPEKKPEEQASQASQDQNTTQNPATVPETPAPVTSAAESTPPAPSQTPAPSTPPPASPEVVTPAPAPTPVQSGTATHTLEPDHKIPSRKILILAASIVVLILFSVFIVFGSALKRQMTSNAQKPSTKTQSVNNTDNKMTAGSNNSDTQLQKDEQNVDASLNSANSDLQTVDQGLNDQPDNLN